MNKKDFKTYLNEAKTKISSVESCITEAHALAENNDKTEVENIMKSLKNIDSSINNIMK
ncbi:MAG: hypothetical protein PUE01_06675 [Clostridiaceae bacterium]|nr:hypothetical protein [Clostridiaceae bacterium]